VDRIVEVSEAEARAMTKRLALEEGVFCRYEWWFSGNSNKVLLMKWNPALLLHYLRSRDRYLSSDLFD
jgi:cysteine synthase B